MATGSVANKRNSPAMITPFPIPPFLGGGVGVLACGCGVSSFGSGAPNVVDLNGVSGDDDEGGLDPSGDERSASSLSAGAGFADGGADGFIGVGGGSGGEEPAAPGFI